MDGRTLRSLTIYFVLWKVFLLLVIILTPGPGYDTSTTLLGAAQGLEFQGDKEQDASVSAVVGSTVLPSFARKLVRWDSIYFVNIAERGYLFEQEWAFGYPNLLRMLTPGMFARSRVVTFDSYVPGKALTVSSEVAWDRWNILFWHRTFTYIPLPVCLGVVRPVQDDISRQEQSHR